jgi:hypothetical protein
MDDSSLEHMILHRLEAQARQLEEEHRYAPQGERIAEYVVDATSFEPLTPWVPRIKLVAVMAYKAKWEQQAHWGKVATLEKYHPKAFLMLACYWEGRRVDLTEAQALRLLAEGDLPPEVQEGVRKIRAEDAARIAAIDTDELFKKLANGPEHQLRGRKYEEKTFQGGTY